MKTRSRKATAVAAVVGLTTAFGSWAGAGAVTRAASQPGITAGTITVASVATLGGPVPGLFQGAPNGASAYFDYVNAHGGVDGRKLVLKSLDDGLSCAINKSDYSGAVNSVFAFVGSMSVVANCGAPVLAANPSVPDISWELDTATRALPNAFDPSPQPNGFRLGPFKWYRQHFPKDTRVAGLYSNQPGAVINWDGQMAAMKSVGFQLVYSRAYAPTEVNFTSDIIRMKAEHVNVLWTEDDDFGTIVRLLSTAQQQNFHPLILGGNNSYSPDVTSRLTNGAGNGMYDDLLHSMFLGEDKSKVPAVATFLTWLAKAHPGFAPDEYTLWGWADAVLFVQALKAAGSNPTQQGVLTALRKIHNFNADGLFAPANIGNHQPSSCYVVIQWTGGKWHRVTPANGFQCSPGGYYHYTGS